LVNYKKEKDKFVTSFVFVPPCLPVTAVPSRDGLLSRQHQLLPPETGRGSALAGISALGVGGGAPTSPRCREV